METKPVATPEKEDAFLAQFGNSGVEEAALAEAGVAGAIAREKAEIEAALTVAMVRPRRDQDCALRIFDACKRPSFARGAVYSFPRAGGKVSGPSVKLARDMAAKWGNIQHGIRVVSMDDEWVHIVGWAWDLQTNTKVQMEGQFKKLIQRKGGWVQPDERDLRELVNKHGAIAVRNAILQLIPSDIVEEAFERCCEVQVKAARGELKGPQTAEQAMRAIAEGFIPMGVTTEMIERLLKHDLKVGSVSPEELTELRRIYRSMADGNSKREDHFSHDDKPAREASVSLSDVKPGEPPAPRDEKPKADANAPEGETAFMKGVRESVEKDQQEKQSDDQD